MRRKVPGERGGVSPAGSGLTPDAPRKTGVKHAAQRPEQHTELAPATRAPTAPSAGHPVRRLAPSKASQAERALGHSSRLGRIGVYARSLGPGLITGASDDDPSGIGAYAQTGAQFGYTQLWTALFTFPLLAAVQEICARIGLQSGEGLAAILRKHYPKALLYISVTLLVFANIVNLGADLGAMAAAVNLLVPVPFLGALAVITLVTILLEVLVDYHRYAKILRLLTLSLFAYILVVFVVPQDWGAALRGTFIPVFRSDRDFLLNLVAVLGTTISPYLFFWQANQEVEEEIDEGRTTLQERRGTTRIELKWMRTDVMAGMFISNAVAWFIIVTTGSTLFRNGITDISSATQAAAALEPIAGHFSSLLFAAGMVGTGLLAVPVLAGASAYAVAETLKLRRGLFLKWSQARGFYTIIAAATVAGAAMNLVGVNPMQALYYAAVANGMVAPLLLVMIMHISNNPAVMGERRNGRVSNALGWLTTVAMTVAALALLWTLT